MVNFTRFDSIISLASYFSNEEICRQFLKEQRWGSVVVCPYCGSVHVYACGDGKRFKCDGCGNKFSVLVGTIFENTKLPLRKWFMAMYLLSSHKKGVSSHQIARDIEVTQKTAWFMLHKIRTLLGQDDNVTLADEVECDEAYMGGREKNKHESKRTEATRGRSTKTKTPVFGMVQRGGKADFLICLISFHYIHIHLILHYLLDRICLFFSLLEMIMLRLKSDALPV